MSTRRERSMDEQSRWGRAALFALILSLPSGCGRSVSAVDPGAVDGSTQKEGPQGELVSLEISPPLLDLALGTSGRLRATGVYADGGTADLTAAADWSSDAEHVATVAGGLVTALSAGKARVAARAAGLRATAVVNVRAVTVTQLFVEPPDLVLGVGGTVRLTARALLSDGTDQDVTDTAAWSADDPRVAEVSPRGVVQALAPGATVIRARIGDAAGEARLEVPDAELLSIEVTPANPAVGVGVRLSFMAMGRFADGSRSDVTSSATWQSSDAGVVVVHATGEAQALAAGTSTVSATIGAVSGSTTVTVTPTALRWMEITPTMTTLAVGGSTQLTAEAVYSDNTSRSVTGQATWISSDPSIATVGTSGGPLGRASRPTPR